MRLFFAIELPAFVQSQLGRLKPVEENRDYRWVDPSLIHVTLVFLGEQPPEKLALVNEVGASAARESSSGTLKLGQPDVFGSKRAPRVLLATLDGDLDALNALQARLDAGLRTAGFALEERPFRPHVTLARRRESARGGTPKGWPPSLQQSAFPMDHLTLFQSRLSPRGPSYIPLFDLPIGS